MANLNFSNWSGLAFHYWYLVFDEGVDSLQHPLTGELIRQVRLNLLTDTNHTAQEEVRTHKISHNWCLCCGSVESSPVLVCPVTMDHKAYEAPLARMVNRSIVLSQSTENKFEFVVNKVMRREDRTGSLSLSPKRISFSLSIFKSNTFHRTF